MARYIFVFEGLFGYGRGAWRDVVSGKEAGAESGGNLLRVIRASGIRFVPGGGSFPDEGTPETHDARATVLSYYDYHDADKAAGFAASCGIHEPVKVDGRMAFHTVVVIGHSFGGDAAWRFAALLSMATPLTIDLGITFDPRSIADLGWGDDHAAWRLNPHIASDRWLNFYRPQGFMEGYPLPTEGTGVQNRVQPNFYDHTGMIATLWKDPAQEIRSKIDAVGTVRLQPDTNTFL